MAQNVSTWASASSSLCEIVEISCRGQEQKLYFTIRKITLIFWKRHTLYNFLLQKFNFWRFWAKNSNKMLKFHNGGITSIFFTHTRFHRIHPIFKYNLRLFQSKTFAKTLLFIDFWRKRSSQPSYQINSFTNTNVTLLAKAWTIYLWQKKSFLLYLETWCKNHAYTKIHFSILIFHKILF